MTDSQTLLADYVKTGSEPAFRELVERYLNLVYSAAVRLVEGDSHLAQDVAQTVFIDLARAARTLPNEVMLGGWLHRHTCFVAANTLRSDRRRRARETQAFAMNALEDHSKANLAQIAPLLDEAINQLGADDRAAILLRFFEQRDFRSVAEALGSNEDAARMRVSRALEKLHTFLAHRGVTLSVAGLGASLGAGAVTAAPAGLAATIFTAALTGAASAGTTLTFLKLMTMTKLQAGIVGAVAIAGVAASLVLHQQANARQRAAVASLQQQADQLARLQTENQRLTSLGSRESDLNANNRQDLLRLRAEADALRKQTNALAALQSAERARGSREPQPAGAKTAFELQEEGMAKMFFAKDWMLAFILYAVEHGERFPTNFDQAASYFPGGSGKHPTVTKDQFELVYRGSIGAPINPSTTVVLREKQAWRTANGNWAKAYGFADGHSEMVRSANGDFTKVERERGLIVGTLNP